MDRGEKKQIEPKRMRKIFFCVFSIIFVFIAADTIAGFFFDFDESTSQEMIIFLKIFIVGIGMAVFGLYKITVALKKKFRGEETPIPNAAGKYKYELTTSDNKTIFQGECRLKKDGRILTVNGEGKKMASINWYSNWTELCKDNKARLHYYITQDEGNRGYAVLEVMRNISKEIMGEFHFLREPYVYGTVKLERA